MDVITTIDAFRSARSAYAQIGFVPTMGFLHAGHLSLVAQARRECGAVAVSIFVNPTQFGPREDFARYPRDLQHDLALLEREHVDLVFVPKREAIYPADFGTYVVAPEADTLLEGAQRPGHFQGVATVVCKLLNIVQPTRAYFGQKDAQQTVIVRRMVRDLNMPYTIVVAPTVREPDGLAMSSRNTYLTPAERRIAPALYRALRAAEQSYVAGERLAAALRAAAYTVLSAESLLQPEYVSIADPLSLHELEQVGARGALVSLAVRLGAVRLIDNLLIEPDATPQPPESLRR